MKNIVTIFSGRQPNLEILIKYLQVALNKNIIHEVHLWNNTRNIKDELYIRNISNIKRTSSLGKYTKINTPIIDNSFSFTVVSDGNVGIFMHEVEHFINYEIIFGHITTELYCNSVLIGICPHSILFPNMEIPITITIIDTKLFIYKNNELAITFTIPDNFIINEVHCKTLNNNSGYFTYNTCNNSGFYLMDTCEKSWKNYYQHYDHPRYINDIIIKCDDDIVFIDINKLPGFIDFIRDNDNDLIFANTINNGVSAFYQQHVLNLIPPSLMVLEYPPNGFEGSLWESGKKAELLHNYFIENYDKFISINDTPTPFNYIPIKTRFSINFFGYKGKDWHKIRDCFIDDEHNLTTQYLMPPKSFNNILYIPLVVSHLSFYKQIETNINIPDLINKYNQLFNLYNKTYL
jgi:hypothetical protein